MTKKLKCISFLSVGLLIPTLGLLCFGWFHAHAGHKKPVATTLVTIGLVSTQLLSHSIEATGNVIAIQNTQLSSKVGGYVTQINYQEGDHVNAGQALVQLDNRHERNAVATAMASYKTSQLQVQRDTRLLKRGLIMQAAYYTAKVAMQQNQAALDKAQDDLADKTISAPFDGTIGSRKISVGDYLNAGNPITTLVDRKDLKAVYTLPSHYQSELKIGQQVVIRSNSTQQKFIAKTSYIAPIVDRASQTIEVHAKFTNQGNVLRPGQYVNVTQVLAQNQPTLVIPMTSAQPSLGGYYVYTIKNNRAKKINITIGQRYNKYVEVTSGLKKGEPVIIGGIDKIHPGSLVKTV